jgi:uncharacterized membrane protein YjgN (DUF898 family)
LSTALTAEHDSQPQPTVTPFEFRGDGAEFFKIWIVNLLLTILTLGIYSAWAKVRSNRYFYSNVYLEGESFRYLAEPMQILLGRLIAVAFFAVYILAAQLSPLVSGVLIILLTIATPFLVIRSLAFNLRMTAYRNIQFRFDASYGEAVMALLVWPFLGVLSLGLLYPYAMLKSHQFLVRNAAYGTTPFGYEATTWAYGRIFLYFLEILVVVGLFYLVFYILFPPAVIIVMAGGLCGGLWLLHRSADQSLLRLGGAWCSRIICRPRNAGLSANFPDQRAIHRADTRSLSTLCPSADGALSS